MTCKVLRLFPNILTADDKYSVVSRDNLMQAIQVLLSQKQTVFSQYFCAFFKSALNFIDFQKRMTLVAYVFPKLPAPKDVVR